MKNKELVGEIVKLYQTGMNHTEIGQKLGLSRDAVRHRLKKEGIPRHGSAGDKDSIVTRQMAELYNTGMTLEQVGAVFGLTRQGVRHRFMVAGILRREKVKPIGKEILEKLYTQDKLPITEIADSLSVSEAVIKVRLKFYEIPKRERIKNGGQIVDFLRSLEINQQKIFEYNGPADYVSLYGDAKNIGIKIKTKRLPHKKYAVIRIA